MFQRGQHDMTDVWKQLSPQNNKPNLTWLPIECHYFDNKHRLPNVDNFAPELLTFYSTKVMLKTVWTCLLEHCVCVALRRKQHSCFGLLLRLSLEENLTDLGCVSQLPGGCTDAILPVTWASENGKAVDVFLILTNNPLWMFAASPLDSLKKHRRVQWFIPHWYNWALDSGDEIICN